MAYTLAGSAIRKCRNGDSISDEELSAGIKVLQQVVPALQAMGEAYYLAYSNLAQKLVMLEDFKEARKR